MSSNLFLHISNPNFFFFILQFTNSSNNNNNSPTQPVQQYQTYHFPRRSKTTGTTPPKMKNKTSKKRKNPRMTTITITTTTTTTTNHHREPTTLMTTTPVIAGRNKESAGFCSQKLRPTNWNEDFVNRGTLVLQNGNISLQLSNLPRPKWKFGSRTTGIKRNAPKMNALKRAPVGAHPDELRYLFWWGMENPVSQN